MATPCPPSDDTALYLRVDVDSYLGTRDGVPRLLDLLERRGLRATFFLSLGPDRWGRAILRVFFRRGFLAKMLRTRAVHSYGLSTCLRGTLLPSVNISRRLAPVLRSIADAGHEVGPHCWDHVLWQDRLHRLSREALRAQVAAACEAFEEIFGEPPRCWASPGWVTTPAALEVLDGFSFDWMSNTRGVGPFVPIVEGRELDALEIPTTSRTLDEDLNRAGITEASYVDHTLATLEQAAVRVHTIHAETEGRHYLPLFERLLDGVQARGWEVRPLGELARQAAGARLELPRAPIRPAEIPGRAGRVSVQGIGAVRQP